MLVAYKVYAKHDANGNPRRGWAIYLVNDTSASYLGFVTYRDYQWTEVRAALGGVVYLGDVETTPGHYRVLMRDSASPAELRRQADAIQGD